jgi:hypothetical protein
MNTENGVYNAAGDNPGASRGRKLPRVRTALSARTSSRMSTSTPRTTRKISPPCLKNPCAQAGARSNNQEPLYAKNQLHAFHTAKGLYPHRADDCGGRGGHSYCHCDTPATPSTSVAGIGRTPAPDCCRRSSGLSVPLRRRACTPPPCPMPSNGKILAALQTRQSATRSASQRATPMPPSPSSPRAKLPALKRPTDVVISP